MPQERTARERVTIYEVAERAGVSIATVSHALNRPEKVGSATRARVLDVVDELGFVLKANAVSSARRGVGRIAVLAPFSAYPTYLERLLGALEECRRRNVDVVPVEVSSDTDSLTSWVRSLPATGRFDGLLVMGGGLDEDVAGRLRTGDLPVVLVDHEHDALSCVTIDDDLGGYVLATHLIERGLVRPGREAEVAVAAPAPAGIDLLASGGFKRVAGMVRALDEHGIDARAITVVVTEDDFDGGLAAAEDILRLPRLPRLVVGHHDAVAAGALTGLRRAGVDVPGQVAVAGYDGTELARGLDLTTVRQPFRRSGAEGARLLMEALGGSTDRQHLRLAPDLVVAGTT